MLSGTTTRTRLVSLHGLAISSTLMTACMTYLLTTPGSITEPAKLTVFLMIEAIYDEVTQATIEEAGRKHHEELDKIRAKEAKGHRLEVIFDTTVPHRAEAERTARELGFDE